MDEIGQLLFLQSQLENALVALNTATPAQAVIIRQNIANLRRQIRRILHIVNFQVDGKRRADMPPPPNRKL